MARAGYGGVTLFWCPHFEMGVVNLRGWVACRGSRAYILLQFLGGVPKKGLQHLQDKTPGSHTFYNDLLHPCRVLAPPAYTQRWPHLSPNGREAKRVGGTHPGALCAALVSSRGQMVTWE